MNATTLSVYSRLAIKRHLPDGFYLWLMNWRWQRLVATQKGRVYPAEAYQEMKKRYQKERARVVVLETSLAQSQRDCWWADMVITKHRLDLKKIMEWGKQHDLDLTTQGRLLNYLEASRREKLALELECLTLRTQSTVDALTGILNRRGLEQGFARELSLMKRGLLQTTESQLERRKGARFTVVMFDLDHFKAVNDGQGHTAGDAVICAVAELATQYLGHRPSDLIGRLGGDEFLVILPDADPEIVAKQAEELLGAMRADRRLQIVEGQPGVTASIGVTSMPVTNESPAEFWQTLYEEADTYMYLAKERGKNQVALAPRLARNPRIN